MASNHQPTVSDPDADMGDSPPSIPPQRGQGQGPPILPPFGHLPAPVSPRTPYTPLAQPLQPSARMLPPSHSPFSAQDQRGSAHFQGHGQIPVHPAPGYHNAQTSQPPQAASSYPTAPGDPTVVSPPVHYLPQYPGLPQGARHTYAPQQQPPAAHPSPPPNFLRFTPINANGNTTSEHCETSTGCIGSYDLTNCTGCIGSYKLTNCTGCINTGDSVACIGCVVCLRCTDCHGCVKCVDCTGCQGCIDCIDCVGLQGGVGVRGARM